MVSEPVAGENIRVCAALLIVPTTLITAPAAVALKLPNPLVVIVPCRFTVLLASAVIVPLLAKLAGLIVSMPPLLDCAVP